MKSPKPSRYSGNIDKNTLDELMLSFENTINQDVIQFPMETYKNKPYYSDEPHDFNVSNMINTEDNKQIFNGSTNVGKKRKRIVESDTRKNRSFGFEFLCVLCNFKRRNKEDVEKHVFNHFLRKTFNHHVTTKLACIHCPQEFLSPGEMKIHGKHSHHRDFSLIMILCSSSRCNFLLNEADQDAENKQNHHLNTVHNFDVNDESNLTDKPERVKSNDDFSQESLHLETEVDSLDSGVGDSNAEYCSQESANEKTSPTLQDIGTTESIQQFELLKSLPMQENVPSASVENKADFNPEFDVDSTILGTIIRKNRFGELIWRCPVVEDGKSWERVQCLLGYGEECKILINKGKSVDKVHAKIVMETNCQAYFICLANQEYSTAINGRAVAKWDEEISYHADTLKDRISKVKLKDVYPDAIKLENGDRMNLGKIEFWWFYGKNL